MLTSVEASSSAHMPHWRHSRRFAVDGPIWTHFVTLVEKALHYRARRTASLSLGRARDGNLQDRELGDGEVGDGWQGQGGMLVVVQTVVAEGESGRGSSALSANSGEEHSL